MLNLTLHCGANEVSRQQIYDAWTPPATQTHYPISHRSVLTEIEDKLAWHGYKVVNEAHGLSHGDARYFGMLELESRSGEHTLVLGARNSHDKRFPTGIAMGTGLFVCDNLSFTGQVKLSRKHTRFITRDLPKVVHRAVSKLGQVQADQEKQIAAYKSHDLTDDRARALMVEGVKRGVFACAALPKILKEWEDPSYDEFADSNLWRLFNAVTEVAKEWSPEVLLRRTQYLHGLCDAEVGLSV